MADTGHACGLTLPNGVELLIHVGVDTVDMGGDGFKLLVNEGDHVKAGQKLIEFDPEKIKAAGHPCTTMLIVTAEGSAANIQMHSGMEAKAGETTVISWTDQGKDRDCKTMKDFRKSTVYQIYPKSFCDTNKDGLGDLRGVISKLDYIKELGVDYIWLTPFFVSPQNDNGYDVADYYNIDPGYGTMEDVEELISEADKRGMGLMFDMVFNHVSTNHEWFRKAMAGDPYYKDFFIFRKGKDNGEPPTNWGEQVRRKRMGICREI